MAEFNYINVNLEYAEHKVVFAENLWKCFVERELLDLVFICDKNIKVFAHKLVFASVSQFLSNIINANGQDVAYINVPDLDHSKIRILVNFLYEGVTRVTYEEMVILREIMILLDIEMKNCEMKPANPLDSFTPIFIRDIGEKDPLSLEHTLQEKSRPLCTVTKVEGNTDVFSNEADNTVLVPFVDDVNILAGTAMNTAVLHEQSHMGIETTEDMIDNKMNSRGNGEDNDKMDVVDLDNDENEIGVINLTSDDDTDIVEVVDNDCETFMETATYVRQDAATLNHLTTTIKNTPTNSIFISIDQISDANIESSFVTEDENYKIIPDMDDSVSESLKYDPDTDMQTTPQSGIKESEFVKHQQKRECRLSYGKRKILEDEYNYNKRPTKQEMSELASELSVDYDTVFLWYKHKRKIDFSAGERSEEKNRQEDFEENAEDSQDSRHSMGSNEGRRPDNRRSSQWYITHDQKAILESEYRREKFPSKEVLKRLENQLGLPVLKIKMWFATRRYKDNAVESFKNMVSADFGRVISDEKRKVLEAQYRKDKYVTLEILENLQKELHLPSFKIKNWFSNRRQKETTARERIDKKNGQRESSMHYIEKNLEDTQDSRYSYESSRNKTLENTEDVAQHVNKVENVEADNTGNNPTIFESMTDANKTVDSYTSGNVSMELEHGSSEQFRTMFNDTTQESSKRFRAAFTDKQKLLLENVYFKNKYPKRATVSSIAKALGQTNARIKVWFQNKRAKDKGVSDEERIKRRKRKHYFKKTQKSRYLYESNANRKSDTEADSKNNIIQSCQDSDTGNVLQDVSLDDPVKVLQDVTLNDPGKVLQDVPLDAPLKEEIMTDTSEKHLSGKSLLSTPSVTETQSEKLINKGDKNDANVSCKTCNKKFISSKSLNRHSCWKYRKHKCSYCDASFDRRDHCNKHVKLHKKIRSFNCVICNLSFSHKNSFKAHNAKIHSESEGVNKKNVQEDSIKHNVEGNLDDSQDSNESIGNEISDNEEDTNEENVQDKDEADAALEEKSVVAPETTIVKHEPDNEEAINEKKSQNFQDNNEENISLQEESVVDPSCKNVSEAAKEIKSDCAKPAELFTKEQLYILEQKFEDNRSPTVRYILDIAKQLHVSGDDVMLWFENRLADVGKGNTCQKMREETFKQTVLNDLQKHELEGAYQENKHPDKDTVADIADMLGLSEKSVLFWFQNRREKEKTGNPSTDALFK